MAKNQKLNGDLLTDEEKGSPMGLGYVSAAERLNLIYLASPEVMLKLLVQFGNEAWEFSMTGGLPKAAFWKAMNEKAETLAIILQGKNPAYMCIPWFTDPNQMSSSVKNSSGSISPCRTNLLLTWQRKQRRIFSPASVSTRV